MPVDTPCSRRKDKEGAADLSQGGKGTGGGLKRRADERVGKRGGRGIKVQAAKTARPAGSFDRGQAKNWGIQGYRRSAPQPRDPQIRGQVTKCGGVSRAGCRGSAANLSASGGREKKNVCADQQVGWMSDLPRKEYCATFFWCEVNRERR